MTQVLGKHEQDRRLQRRGDDLAWIRARGAELCFADSVLERGLDVVTLLDRACREGAAFVSIDIDALDQSVAPGVSAPAPLGLPT